MPTAFFINLTSHVQCSVLKSLLLEYPSSVLPRYHHGRVLGLISGETLDPHIPVYKLAGQRPSTRLPKTPSGVWDQQLNNFAFPLYRLLTRRFQRGNHEMKGFA